MYYNVYNQIFHSTGTHRITLLQIYPYNEWKNIMLPLAPKPIYTTIPLHTRTRIVHRTKRIHNIIPKRTPTRTPTRTPKPIKYQSRKSSAK